MTGEYIFQEIEMNYGTTRTVFLALELFGLLFYCSSIIFVSESIGYKCTQRVKI